jgi:outer membrane murein-binding lipoprotein Lpp
MPVKTLQYSAVLKILECGHCGIPFALPADFHERVQRTGEAFWCPNGGKISYSATENDKLKARLADEKRWRENAETQAKAARDQADAAERRVTAYKGVVTRTKKRAAAGVCQVPGCKRHFADLQRHMESRHPGYGDSES